jgi:hypothetical protein
MVHLVLDCCCDGSDSQSVLRHAVCPDIGHALVILDAAIDALVPCQCTSLELREVLVVNRIRQRKNGLVRAAAFFRFVAFVGHNQLSQLDLCLDVLTKNVYFRLSSRIRSVDPAIFDR